jgi:hypothetical protein
MWTPLKTGGELRCSGRVSSSCSTSGTHRVKLYNKKLEVTIQFNFHTKMSFQSEQSQLTKSNGLKPTDSTFLASNQLTKSNGL